MGLQDKVALVTGASQGIGRATAEALAAAGARVVLAARGADKLAAVEASLGERALGVACDVTDPAAVDALYATIGERFGRLDVVFNNAGAALISQEPGDVEWDEWRRVVGVNLDGAFLIARGAFRMMRDQSPQGGRIINNGSISADDAAAGLDRLHRLQARDHRADQVDLARRPALRHRLRPDRHRQRRLGHDRRRCRRACPRPTAACARSRR